jgi:hypothetical protein
MTPPATYKKRVQIHTLCDIGGDPESIAEHLYLSLRQVDYLSKQPTTPRKCPGHPVTIDTPRRKELIDSVTLNDENRRLLFHDILCILN